MDVYTAVIGKRDRREYDGRPIPEDVTHRLLQAGRMAGTSSNKQQLRFIAMTDSAVREALSQTGPGGAPIRNAPFAVAILRERDARDFDVGRAAQNMMVVAQGEGLLSCPIGIRDEDAARGILGYPEEYVIAIAVAFGYPQADLPGRESRPRLPMEEIVHRERW
ncbi:MAG: nitroreductase family protein [Dehalococcoidia bacterium]